MNTRLNSQNTVGNRLIIWLLPLCLLAASGCRVVKQTAALPANAVEAVVPGTKSKQLDPGALQTELLRFAESFSGQTSLALDDYARRVNTPAGGVQALRWKLSLGSSVLGIATAPNPTANLIDFISLATLMRMSLEERATNAVPPGALDPWLDTSRALETNAWKLATGVLTSDQQSQLRSAIERWRAQNTSVGASFFARPQELATAIRQGGEKQSQPEGVFSLVGLDPMSGLDPAVREVTRTRLFAERALFAAQRMPLLVRWQTELLTDEVLAQNQITNALASAERLSRAAESVSQTAAALPQNITDERKAILAELQSQEGQLRGLTAQVGETLTAGEKMSTSLNTTLVTFSGLMKLLGVGAPSTAPPDTNSPPFNILDYAKTADEVGKMAQQLDLLLKDASGTVQTPALDKRIAELNALTAQARADAKSVLNHAFLLAAGLIVLAFGCAIVYRRLLPQRAPVPAAPRLPEAKP
jgi:hypothetical protein